MGLYTKGVVSICFDDAYAAHWATAFPALHGIGGRATLLPIIENVKAADAGSSLYTTTAQLQTMQASGWEVGAHAYTQATHRDYKSMAQSDALDDLLACQQWLAENQLRGGGTFAHPLGCFQPGASTALSFKQLIAPYIDCARTILSTNGRHETLPPADLMELRAQSGIGPTGGGWYTVTTTQLDHVLNRQEWAIFVIHDIQAASSDVNTCTTAAFTTLLANIDARSIPIVPIGEVVRKLLA